MSQRLPPYSADQLLQSLSSLPPASSWLVGFSGGADSTALLHAMVQLREQLQTPFRAVHINHGLHPDSHQWSQHCEALCRDWSVAFTSLNVHIDGTGQGLEAEARERRYTAINTLLKNGEAVFTAHHADDQAETLLLNLMRGSGVDGLSAMPPHKAFGQNQLQRPLLRFHRQALVDYLNLHGIKWLEDPSNQNVDQDRNFIRNKALPLLESQFAGSVKRLLLTQQAMLETRALLKPLAEQHLQAELLHPLVLRISNELLNNPALFKLVIRRWLKRSGVPGLPARQLTDLFSQLQHASSGHQISVMWTDFCIRFYQKHLWLQQGADIETCPDLEWPENSDDAELSPNLGNLHFAAENQFVLPGKITITSRHSQPGLSLLRGDHHQSIKNLFQAAAIPVWLRDSIPMTLIDDELVAVGDWALSKTFASWLSENHVKFSWQPNAPILQYLTLQQHHRARQT